MLRNLTTARERTRREDRGSKFYEISDNLRCALARNQRRGAGLQVRALQITRTVAVRCASGRCVIQWLHSTVTGKVSPEIAPSGGRSRTS